MPSPLRPVLIFLATGERRVEKRPEVWEREKGRRAGVRDDKGYSYMSATGVVDI
jgi:hypothetical protein